RVLREVPDPPAQRGRPRLVAQHPYRAGLDLLHPDHAPHQGGLAAAARTEQSGHAAARDRTGEAVQYPSLAAYHAEVADLDRLVRIVHERGVYLGHADAEHLGVRVGPDGDALLDEVTWAQRYARGGFLGSGLLGRSFRDGAFRDGAFRERGIGGLGFLSRSF